MTYETLQPPMPKHVGNDACLASSNPSSPTLYVTGGSVWNGSDAGPLNLKKLQIWEANEWREGPDMIYSRERHGCTVVNDWLWIIGGNDRIEMEAINISNIDESSWELKGHLDREIAEFGVVAIDHLIYVVGGCMECESSSRQQALDIMYMIDTLNGDVTAMSMGFPIYGMPVVAVDGIMYGFWGRDDSGQEKDSWALCDLLSTVSVT